MYVGAPVSERLLCQLFGSSVLGSVAMIQYVGGTISMCVYFTVASVPFRHTHTHHTHGTIQCQVLVSPAKVPPRVWTVFLNQAYTM